MSEQRMESGMETAMMMVERQLPRKTRIMMAVRQAAMMASRTTPLMAPRTKIDWSERALICNCGGKLALDVGELGADAVDDVERGGRAGLQDAHQDGALAIDAHDVGLRRIAVAHVGHVADVDDRAVDRLDGQVVQLVDKLRARSWFRWRTRSGRSSWCRRARSGSARRWR